MNKTEMNTLERKALVKESFVWDCVNEREIPDRDTEDYRSVISLLQPMMDAFQKEVKHYSTDLIYDLCGLEKAYHDALGYAARHPMENIPALTLGFRKCGVDSESFIISRFGLRPSVNREQVFVAEYTSIWMLSLVFGEDDELYAQLHKAVFTL